MGIIGSNLAKKLLAEKAELIITDIDESKIENFLHQCGNTKSVTSVEFTMEIYEIIINHYTVY